MAKELWDQRTWMQTGKKKDPLRTKQYVCMCVFVTGEIEGLIYVEVSDDDDS